MLSIHNVAKDMVWNLGHREFHEDVVNFLKRFEASFCMFSKGVQQVYSSYQLHDVKQDERHVVAIPDPYKFHDTFNNIPKQAIKPTGLYVIPGEAANDEGLMLYFPKTKKRVAKVVPIKKGIDLLRKKYGETNFTPVIVNSDLKTLACGKPVMHLHRVDVEELDEVAPFKVVNMTKAINKKLDVVFDS